MTVGADRVRALRRLHSKSIRDQTGRFLVEGPSSVTELLQCAPDSVQEVFVAQSAQWQAPPAAQITVVEDRVVAALAETTTPAGVVALASYLDSAPDQWIPRLHPWSQIVVLDALGDPGNAGTILRTAAAVGATGVVFAEGSVDPYNGKVVRSSAGALFQVPVARGLPLAGTLTELKTAGYTVVATDVSAEQSLSTFVRQQPAGARIAWVVGSEAHGVSEASLSLADFLIKIPMPGATESLNAAVAAGICLYSAQLLADESPANQS